MPAVKTGMTPPPMPGMPAPMQPMGGVPPMQNPFAPMPPMPLAGAPMPQPQPPMPPMAQGQMPQGQQQQVMGSTAGRRRRFGDALEGILGGNQGIGAAMPQQQRPLPMPQMMPQQRMVAPNTPMMRTPTPRPMAMGGIVQYFAPGGDVNQFAGDRPNVREFMDATGASASEASQILYGSVGSNVDIRDWDAIMSSNNPIAAAQAATGQMYTSGANYATDSDFYDDSGNYNPTAKTAGATTISGSPRLQQVGNQVMIVDSQGLPLTGLSPQNAASFGITQADIDAAIESGAISGERAGRFEGVGFVPGDYGNLLVDYSDLGKVSPYVSSGGGGGSSSSDGGSAVVSGDSGQMVGDIGVSAGSNEMSALYGPNINIPQKISQYVQDPVTGQITTTAGPVMTAISPIGAINLPARPVELDIFDYLGDPTYGSLLDKKVEGMADGGSVPRQTMIADEPHMLAYINQDEEALLRSFGGSGISGPGGIPSYPLDDLGVGAINSGKTYSGSDKAVSGGFDAAAATADDDKPSSRDSIGSSGYTSLDAIAAAAQAAADNEADRADAARAATGSSGYPSLDAIAAAATAGDDSSNVTSAPVGEVDLTTIDPVTGSQTTVATIDYGTGSDDDGYIAPVVTPTYTDRQGNEYSSQALADAADRAFAAQLASYGAGKVGFDRFKSDAAETFPGRPREETDRMAARAYSDFVEDYSRDVNIFDPAPFTYTGIGGIGAGPESGSLGVTPAPITSPDVSGTVSSLEAGPAGPADIETDLFGTGLGSDILSLATPSAATMYPYDVPSSVLADQLRGGPLTPGMVPPESDVSRPAVDQPLTDDDMGLPSGPVTDIQRGLGATGPIAARDADMDPFGTGTQLSLQDVKDRVARAEGTADEGGYGRLLGGQEGRFDVDLTNMTVQEVLDFQKQRGPGSYAEYSQGVNKQRGAVRDDGTGKISTPAGKYQVVGATLEDLIDKGVVDPNAKFDEGTQEKIGSYLIAERRGLNDLQAGNITREQFEENLGKEFEGIKRGLDKGAGSTSAVIAAASETGRQAEVDRRDENVEKIQQQIGDQAEPTGVEKFFYDVVGQLGLGLGKPFADKLRGASREERQAIIDQHVYALKNGATPKTDEEGNYVGFDISTMDTFADKVLGAEDITQFLPGGAEDADGDGVPDYVRFGQVYDAQSTAAAEDPYGYSTEQGFITSDGKEFFVDASGNVVEITDGTVPFEPGGGEDVAAALGVTETITGGEDSGTTMTDDTGHVDGVCNTEGYVYNPETDMCEPPSEKEKSDTVSSPISTTGRSMRSFEDILAGITTPAPKIAPISANIRPMQGGGMVGLNRAADNFIKALAG